MVLFLAFPMKEYPNLDLNSWIERKPISVMCSVLCEVIYRVPQQTLAAHQQHEHRQYLLIISNVINCPKSELTPLASDNHCF